MAGEVETREGWGEWGRHVLAELERNHADHKELFRLLRKTEVEIATLKVKAAFAGAIGGGVMGLAIGLAIYLIKK